MPPDIGAVIFDLDGLVLDTEITYFSAWRQAAYAMGHRLSMQFCQSLSGLHYGAVEEKMIAQLGSGFDLVEFNRLSGECWRKYVQIQGIPVKKGFHGLLELINQLDLPYCLATNSRMTNALECLELAKLADFFPVVVARDHVEHGKPAPDVFLAAAERLAVDISRCLVLEDSPTGIAAATKAGAFSVFVPSALPADRDASALCHLQCRDLDEVTRLLRSNLTNRQ